VRGDRDGDIGGEDESKISGITVDKPLVMRFAVSSEYSSEGTRELSYAFEASPSIPLTNIPCDFATGEDSFVVGTNDESPPAFS
jgi:hypothetical protein